MADILREQLEGKRASFERTYAPIEQLVESVVANLKEEGRSLGGKEKNGAAQGAPKKVLLRIIRECVSKVVEERTEAGGKAGDEVGGDVFDVLGRKYEEEKEATGGAADGAADGDEEEEEDDNDNDNDSNNDENKKKDDENALMVFDFTKPAKKKVPAKGAKASPSWKGQLLEILKKMGDVEKVTAERPSTGPFGNWGIISAVTRVSEGDEKWDFKAESVLGKKMAGKAKSGYFVLSKKDGEVERGLQWSGIRNMFGRDDSVLLSHHKNHYALIFAIREWRNGDGSWVRQMLTARKGQRPTTWVDFEEMRDCYLGWDGYKMMCVTGRKL